MLNKDKKIKKPFIDKQKKKKEFKNKKDGELTKNTTDKTSLKPK